MAKVRIKINHRALAQATIQSPEARRLVADEAEQVAARARGHGAKIVTFHGGISRARSYVTRLGARDEARDAALIRALRP